MDIVFENNDILIVNKPSGMLMHKTSKQEKDTLVDRLLKQYPELADVGDIERPAIVHRLDRQTSGLVIAARNQETYEILRHMFQDRVIEKKYYALVWGKMKEDSGIIEKQITAYKGKRRTIEVWSRQKPNKIRDAITHWKVSREFDEYSLLEVSPKTGRMHQIRVHLASINHPVVCDPLYSGKKKCPEGLGRLFLHAYKLNIPFEGENIEVEIPLATDLEKFLKQIAYN